MICIAVCCMATALMTAALALLGGAKAMIAVRAIALAVLAFALWSAWASGKPPANAEETSVDGQTSSGLIAAIVLIAIVVEVALSRTVAPLLYRAVQGTEALLVPALLAVALLALASGIRAGRRCAITQDVSSDDAVASRARIVIFVLTAALMLCPNHAPASASAVWCTAFGLECIVCFAAVLIYAFRSLPEPEVVEVEVIREVPVKVPVEMPAAESQTTAPATSLEAQCASLAQRYGLTAREADILAELAVGRSRPRIAESNHVSISTVNTHVQHIYEKCSCHSKQELLDLVRSK